MRIRGVIVLLVTLVVVMGIMVFLSLSLTGNVIEEGIETPESLVAGVETPQAADDKIFSHSPKPLLSPISGFALRASLTGMTLQWDAPLDADKIIIWRASAEDGPWFIHEVVSAEQGTYNDEELSVFSQYNYRIQGFEGAELSALSESLSGLAMYDGSAVVVSEADTDLFENSDTYLDERLPSEEYQRRLALYNQKTYCEILSLMRTGEESELRPETLADCNTLARVTGKNSAAQDLFQSKKLLPNSEAGMGGKSFAVGGGSPEDSGGSKSGSGGNAVGAFAARHPNSLIAVGAFEGTAIGVGGTMLAEQYSPGAGIIFGTITGEFSPLAHLGGSAAAATRAGISVAHGSSTVKNYWVTLTKGAGTAGHYEPVIAPEAGGVSDRDALVYYDSGTGAVLGTSKRTMFDAQGRAIPILEFRDWEAMSRYVAGMESESNGIMRASDGSLFLPYVRGKELPSVLPDVDANTILITGEKPRGWFEFGGKQRAERVLVEKSASDTDVALLGKGLEAAGERVYHAPDAPETQVYMQRVGEDAGIVGASDNALIIKSANEEMRKVLAKRPMVVKGDTLRELERDIVCSGECDTSIQSKTKRQKVINEINANPSKYMVSFETLRASVDKLSSFPHVQQKFRDALEYLKSQGTLVYINPDLPDGGFYTRSTNAIILQSASSFQGKIDSNFLSRLESIYHEAIHVITNNRIFQYYGDSPSLSFKERGIRNRERFAERIPVVYDRANNRILFLHEVDSLSSDMVPFITSVESVDEAIALIEGSDLITKLGYTRDILVPEYSQTSEDFLFGVFRFLGDHYNHPDPNILLLDNGEFSFLRSLNLETRHALISNPADLASQTDKTDALLHLELVEQHGIPTGITAEAISRARAILVGQLTPYRDKLTAGQKAVVGRAMEKAEVVSEQQGTSLTPQGISAREAVNKLSRAANNPSATVKMFDKNVPAQTADGVLVVSKLVDGTLAVGRGSNGERSIRTLEQLIEEPREQLFKIQRQDTLVGSSATAAAKITPHTIDDIFKSVYDTEKRLYGAKGVVYRDEFGSYHVRFWDEGNIGPRDIHHQDALAELLRKEAEGFRKRGKIIEDKSMIAKADDNELTARALNEDRKRPSKVYSDENLLNSEGFQFTRDSSGKVVAFDISSSMSGAQISRDIVLDGARLSEMIRAVHESIAPELRGYRIIRVEGLQGLKIRGDISLPDGLELKELFDYPL